MTETKKNNFNLIAAIAFVILALIQCYSFSVTARIYGTFNAYILISLLRMAAYILPAAALFTDRRDKTGTGLILSGLGVLAFLSLYDFFHGFAVHSYSVYDFYYSYYSGSYYAYHFNLFCMLPALIELLGSLCMFAVSLCLLTGYIPKAKSRAKDFWYLPAVLTAASLILGIFLSVVFRIVSDGWTYDVLHTEAAFFSCLLIIAAFLFTAGRIAYPDGFEKKAYARMSSGGPASGIPGTGAAPAASGVTPPQENGYVDMVKCVLLLIFTFGIYWLIWIYRTTGYLNRTEDEPPHTPAYQLLLCLFVPFYQIYWVYQSAKRIDRLAVSRGIGSDLTVICLILAIFVPIIAPMLMQDKINSIAAAESGMTHAGSMSSAAAQSRPQPSQQPPQQPPQQPRASRSPSPRDYLGIAEELKTYKELLDQGVITQEEFDKKKKQLLDL